MAGQERSISLLLDRFTERPGRREPRGDDPAGRAAVPSSSCCQRAREPPSARRPRGGASCPAATPRVLPELVRLDRLLSIRRVPCKPACSLQAGVCRKGSNPEICSRRRSAQLFASKLIRGACLLRPEPERGKKVLFFLAFSFSS